MIRNARSTLTWLLVLSLAACAADSEPPHEQATLGTTREVQAEPAAVAPAAHEVAPPFVSPTGAPEPLAASTAIDDPSSNVPAAAAEPLPVAPATPSTTPPRSQVTGVVTNIGVALPALGLAGQGTLAIAAKVRVSELRVGVGLNLLGEVAIDATGSFSLQVPVQGELLFAEVLDAAGHVLGGSIASASGSVSGQISLGPITAESSLALQLLRRATALACSQQSAAELTGLALDATLLANAGLSTELAAALKVDISGGGVLDVLDALAEALVAARRARAAVLLDAGVALDADVLRNAELVALGKLNAGLTAEVAGQAEAGHSIAQLIADLELALGAAGATADVGARAQVAASLGLGASLRASLADNATLGPVLFPALHAAAQLEVRAALPVLTVDLTVSGASEPLSAKVAAAGHELAIDVRAATSLDELTRARTTYLQKLHGDRASRGLISGLLGATTEIVNGVLDPVLGTIDELTKQIDASVTVHLDAPLRAGVCAGGEVSVDVELGLQGLVDTLLGVQAELRATSAELAQAPLAQTTAEALANVLATAEIILHVTR